MTGLGHFTSIIYLPHSDRYEIFIDNQPIMRVRGRTFKGLNLKVGDHITKDELEQRESFIFKTTYQNTWVKEKERLNIVSDFIKSIDPQLIVEISGFGAQSTQLIKSHPKDKGRPDLTVYLNHYHNIAFVLVEVSGSERLLGGASYWIRPDKIDYMRNHPQEDLWFALCYTQMNILIFIKPDLDKNYPIHKRVLHNNITEYYVEFYPNSPEVITKEQFAQYVRNKIAQIRATAIPFKSDYPKLR